MFLEAKLLVDFTIRAILLFFLAYAIKWVGRKSSQLKSPDTTFYSLKSVLVVLCIALASSYVNSYIVALYTSLQDMPSTANFVLFYPLLTMLPHVVVFATCYILISVYYKRRFMGTFLNTSNLQKTVKWFVWIICIYGPLCFIMFKEAAAASFIDEKNIFIVPNPTQTFLIIGFFGPIVEELLMRGILYKKLRSHLNISLAIFFTALIDVVLHQRIIGLSEIIVIFLISVFFCYSYEKGQSLLIPILAHVIINSLRIFYHTPAGFPLVTSQFNLNFYIVFVGIICAGIILPKVLPFKNHTKNNSVTRT